METVLSGSAIPVSHNLQAMVSIIDGDHDRIDALSVQTARLLASVPGPAHARDEIRLILHDSLKTFLEHFLHEHEAMHQVGASHNYIEAHADEHDDLMVQLRIVTERFQAGDASSEILADLARIHAAVDRHRATADADLYRYLRAAIDLPAPVAR